MFKRDRTTFPNIDNYSTFSSEYNWEDMYIQLINQQTCVFNIYIRGVHNQSLKKLCAKFGEV